MADSGFLLNWLEDVDSGNRVFIDDLVSLDQRIVPVATRTDLKSIDAAPGEQFSLEEEGRSGLFIIKSGTPPSDPQEGVYVVLDNGNYAMRLFEGISPDGGYVVTWFGAKYDGVTDDTVAHQAALNLAPSRSVVKLGAGSTVISADLTSTGKAVVIKGEGISATNVKYTGSGACFNISPGDILNSVVIRDFTISASNPSVASGTAVQVTYPTTASWSGQTLLMEDLEIYSSLVGGDLPYWGAGISLENCWNSRINNVWFNGRANDSSTTSHFINFGENCTDAVVSNCHGLFCVTAINQSAYSEGLQITNSVFVEVFRGYNCSSGGALAPRIESCHINANAECIRLNNVDQAQVNNNLLYLTDAASATCILLENSSDNQVYKNICFAADGSPEGISIIQGSGASTRNRIEDNDFQGHSAGVTCKAGTVGNIVRGNSRHVAGIAQSNFTDGGSNIIIKRSYDASLVRSLVGGAGSEAVNIPLPTGFFSQKPSTGFLTSASASQPIVGFYDLDHPDNTKTNARFVLVRMDGSVISGGGQRFSASLTE